MGRGEKNALDASNGGERRVAELEWALVFFCHELRLQLDVRQDVARVIERRGDLALVEGSIGMPGRDSFFLLERDRRAFEEHPPNRRLGHHFEEAVRMEGDEADV